MKKTSSQGFTLIELIIVIAIIAILAAAIFVAIDPARRLHEARNARRSSDIATILEGVKKYQADNGGSHYSSVSNLTNGAYYTVGTCATGGDAGCGAQTTNAACVNLSLIGSNYLGVIPRDPNIDASSALNDYYMMKDSNGAITVGACDTEGEGSGGTGTEPTISLTR